MKIDEIRQRILDQETPRPDMAYIPKSTALALIAVAEAARDAESQMHCMCKYRICEKCVLLKELEKLEGEG